MWGVEAYDEHGNRISALVLGDTEKALILAENVDGGDRYLPLLTYYADEGYTISDAAKDAVLAGDYHRVKELESNEHGPYGPSGKAICFLSKRSWNLVLLLLRYLKEPARL
ncbi:MAG: hypothetical protein KGZ79_07670 [Dethiobacter sp.]|jgi:hypothetical protein|nr:hypothetical protein [Dethiobacter sp.]